MQTVAVILLVAAAAFFLVHRLVRVFRTGKSPCGCCDSGTCPASPEKRGTVLEDHRKDPSSETSNGENA